jgi:low affinity Fe/Cu permease
LKATHQGDRHCFSAKSRPARGGETWGNPFQQERIDRTGFVDHYSNGEPVPQTMQTLLTAAGTWMARPAAFGFVAVYVAFWMIFDRESFNFHGAVALITLCMTLFIQRSEHRDTQAIQAKLDELLRAQEGARDGLSRIDDQQPEQIEAHRDEARSKE